MNRKLIFLDVDGTLTAPGGVEPPESALKAIKRAQELGHKVFLCSGRNFGMLGPLRKYGFDGGVASCGGYVYAGDKVIYDCPLTEEQKQRLKANREKLEAAAARNEIDLIDADTRRSEKQEISLSPTPV